MNTDIIAVTPPRGRARLSLYVAATVLLALFLGLLNPLGAGQSAQAADGNPHFKIGTDRWSYYDFISKIRRGVNAYNNSVPGSSSTVDHTTNIPDARHPESAGFFDVDVQAWNNDMFVRIRLRRVDLYVVGWWSSDGVYNYIDPSTAASGAPSNSRATVFRGDYGSLESIAGASRYEVTFSRDSMNTAVWALYNARPSGTAQRHREQAHAVLMMTQFISEAARYVGIANLLGPTMDLNGQGHIPWQIAGEENNWGRLSADFNKMLKERTSDSTPSTAWTADYWGNLVTVVLYQLSDYARILNTAKGFPK
ncbi:ribosome-inactivating family protein [Streptomyces sp. NPDC002143]